MNPSAADLKTILGSYKNVFIFGDLSAKKYKLELLNNNSKWKDNTFATKHNFEISTPAESTNYPTRIRTSVLDIVQSKIINMSIPELRKKLSLDHHPAGFNI